MAVCSHLPDGFAAAVSLHWSACKYRLPVLPTIRPLCRGSVCMEWEMLHHYEQWLDLHWSVCMQGELRLAMTNCRGSIQRRAVGSEESGRQADTDEL